MTKLKTVNRLNSSVLRVGQVLRVPLRGPCTNCPVPPVPPRRVPPPVETTSAAMGEKPQGGPAST